jgi:hypothetical protein
LNDNPHLGALPKMRFIRRLLACATKIVTKYIVKNDMHHFDVFGKVMDKSLNYLQQWHDILSLFVVKTNPKFAHLQGLLDDMTNDSEDDMGTLSKSKRESRLNNSGSQTSKSNSSTPKTSLFVNMLKHQSNNLSHRDKPEELLENTFNFLEGSRLVNEEFTGKEINSKFENNYLNS